MRKPRFFLPQSPADNINTFNAEDQKDNEAQIIKLNQYITKAALKEFEDGLKNLKALEHSVADDTYVQMVGATQGQYIQMLLRLKALDAKFANQFSAEISAVTQKIAYLGQLTKAYKNELTVADIEKNEKQRKAFRDWALEQIKIAETLDAKAEKIAAGWITTRRNEKVVNLHVEAWQTIMSIHPGDLQAVDPALHTTVENVRKQIENHWEPNDYQRKRVKYKRIIDF